MKIELIQMAFGKEPNEPAFVPVDLSQTRLICDLLGSEDTVWSLHQVCALVDALHKDYDLNLRKFGPKVTITYVPAGGTLEEAQEAPETETDVEPAFMLMGPDKLPTDPDGQGSLDELVRAAARFVLFYVDQGYYKTAHGQRMPLGWVADNLRVIT